MSSLWKSKGSFWFAWKWDEGENGIGTDIKTRMLWDIINIITGILERFAIVFFRKNSTSVWYEPKWFWCDTVRSFFIISNISSRNWWRRRKMDYRLPFQIDRWVIWGKFSRSSFSKLARKGHFDSHENEMKDEEGEWTGHKDGRLARRPALLQAWLDIYEPVHFQALSQWQFISLWIEERGCKEDTRTQIRPFWDILIRNWEGWNDSLQSCS